MTTPPSVAPLDEQRLRRERLKSFANGFAVALVLCGVLGLAAYAQLRRNERAIHRSYNLAFAVVAAQDIPEGTTVTMEMISQRQVPEQFMTSSVVKPDSASYIVNQRTLFPLQAGDLVLWSAFETGKAVERLTPTINGDHRLVSLKVSNEVAVGGWIRPNDHVDIIAVYPAPESKEPTVTTLLTDVPVIATGSISGTTNINLVPREERPYSNITVRVSSDDAERLALMASVGTLSLSLRPEADGGRRTGKRTVRDVVGR